MLNGASLTAVVAVDEVLAVALGLGDLSADVRVVVGRAGQVGRVVGRARGRQGRLRGVRVRRQRQVGQGVGVGAQLSRSVHASASHRAVHVGAAGAEVRRRQGRHGVRVAGVSGVVRGVAVGRIVVAVLGGVAGSVGAHRASRTGLSRSKAQLQREERGTLSQSYH